jgi:hypothetical protein
MSKSRISILLQLTRMSIVTAIFAVAVLGYSFYHYQMIADQFGNFVNRTVERTLDISDRQIDLVEFVSAVQEVFVYDDTTFLSVTGINQRNLQAANDEWEEIYKYTDKVQRK